MKNHFHGFRRLDLLLIILLILPLTGLTGCAFLEDSLLKASGIAEDSDYLEYQSLLADGTLDSDGLYTSDELSAAQEESAADPHAGQVHVTFADNTSLSIAYYSDEALTAALDTADCYLDKEASIYYGSAKSRSQSSNLYRLSEFWIYEFSADGTRELVSRVSAEESLIYKIPASFDGSGLQIVPVGEYPDRELYLSVYMLDASGESSSLTAAGTWYINGEEATMNATVSSLESYTIVFDYDADSYFFVSSTPKEFNKNETSGLVEFFEQSSTDETVSYSIELHPYLSLTLSVDQEATISSGDSKVTVKKNKKWTRSDLKFGDSITIETEGKVTIYDGDYTYVTASKDDATSTYKLTLEQNPPADSKLEDLVNVERTFSVYFDTQDEHGSLTFKRSGEALSGETAVHTGDVIDVSYELTDKDYQFTTNESWIDGVLTYFTKTRTAKITIENTLENRVIDMEYLLENFYDTFAVEKKEK